MNCSEETKISKVCYELPNYLTISAVNEYSLFNKTNISNNSYVDDPSMNRHFLTPTEVVIALIFIYIADVFIIVANFLVISAFVTDKKIRVPRNYYICNLAVCDLIVGIFIVPSYSVTIVLGDWEMGHIFCIIWTMVNHVTLFVSHLTILLVAYDRYKLVKDAVKYNATETTYKAKVRIGFTWITVLALKLLLILPTEYYYVHKQNSSKPSCSPWVAVIIPYVIGLQSYDIAMSFFGMILEVFMPLSLVAAFHWKVLKSIRKRLHRKNDTLSNLVNNSCKINAIATMPVTDSQHHQATSKEKIQTVSCISQKDNLIKETTKSPYNHDSQPPKPFVCFNCQIKDSESRDLKENDFVHNLKSLNGALKVPDIKIFQEQQNSNFNNSSVKELKNNSGEGIVCGFGNVSEVSLKQESFHLSSAIYNEKENQLIDNFSMEQTDNFLKELSLSVSNVAQPLFLKVNDKAKLANKLQQPKEVIPKNLCKEQEDTNQTTANKSSSSSQNAITHKSLLVTEHYQTQSDHKAVITITLLLLCFVIFKLPLAIAIIDLAVCPGCIGVKLFQILLWIFWSKSIPNPFLYAFISRKFRNFMVTKLKKVRNIFCHANQVFRKSNRVDSVRF